ncbi:MAG: hypothetical protein QOF33_4672 [Thermomicrobiales bacterium]|nr:hypothetical protein [Thermomicrobiales bacterium]
MRNRSLLAVVVMLVVGMAFTAGIGSGAVRAQDDAALSAAVVGGSCESPGDVAGELRDLAPAEGGVLTSFTRVDLPIDDLTGAGYAIVVTSDGNTAACGDISGSGNDVYVAVTSQSDAGYGGVAWLHARDAQTQVSLFISQGLGGGGGGDNNNGVEPPSDETPEPPADDTPEAKPTRTPKAKPTEETNQGQGEGTTYTSPTFGYTVTYDETWEVVEEQTTPTDNGPQDFLKLTNRTSFAYFYTNGADESFPIEQLPQILQSRLEGGEGITNVEVRTDDNGDEITGSDDTSAWVAFNFTWTNQDGKEFELYDYYHGYKIPGQGAVLIFLNEGLQRAYDQQAPAREALENSINIPG